MEKLDRKWIAIWILIYAGFLISDALFENFFGTTVLKYTGIVLCVIYAIVKFKKDYFLELALGFTLLADTILAINNTAIIGVFVFCFAQFFHLTRLKKIAPRNLFLYFVVISLIFCFGVAYNADPMYVIAGLYGMTLGANIYLSYRWCKEKPSFASKCAFYGFVLFICCDICVAFSYLSGTGVLIPEVYRVANYLAWAFYYPSQVLISNSGEA